MVVVTQDGLVFHKNSACLTLLDSRLSAARQGQQANAPQRIPLATATAQGRSACERCFPDYQSGG